MLFIEEGDHYFTFVLSNHEAQRFQTQMQHNPIPTIKQRKVTLFTSGGILTQNGPSNLGLTADETSRFKSTHKFQDVISDISLINGQLAFVGRLGGRLRRWHGFWTFWKRIRQYSAEPEMMNVLTIERFASQKIPKS